MNGQNTAREHAYSEAQARHWLSFIARQMQHHGQSVFRLEEIQPSWLVRRHEHVIYVLTTRILAGLIVGVVAASLNMSLSLSVTESTGKSIAVAFWKPLGWGLIAGLATGIAMLLQLEPRIRSLLQLKSELVAYLLFAVLGAIVAAIGMAVHAVVLFWWTREVYKSEELVLLVLIALMTGNFNADIQSTETLGWSFRDSISGAIAGALVSCTLICFFVFQVSGMQPSQRWAWTRVISVTILGTIIGSAFHGFRGTAKLIDSRPNQGIYLSAKHSIIAGLSIGCLAGLLWGSCVGIQLGDWRVGIKIAIVAFIANYLVAAFWFGGHDVMRHVVLRSLLVVFGYLPLHLVHFLDFADTRLSFLQPSGGGYQFIHRYLQDHFAK
jgi:hypothetical protein